MNLKKNYKILCFGFWKGHNFKTNHIYLNALKNNNYNVDQSNIISDELLTQYDVIICGSFINNPNDISILKKHINKVIYNITEPVEFSNVGLFELYHNNLIKLTVGCVKENEKNIKYPHYMDWGLSIDKIIETNNYIKNISYEEIINKKFCNLINRHDNGKTRTPIYNKLKNIGHIDCPGALFNNYPNDKFEKIGRTEFQKNYLFTICPENYVTKNPGYVTEKIYMASIAGTIPIYCGDLDNI